MNPPEFWWCCLRSGERVVMRAVAEGVALTLGLGIPLDLYELAWFASGVDTELARAAFEALYHLEIGTIEEGGVPIDAMIPVDGFTLWWLGIFAWTLLPGSACLDGCQQSQRPSL